MRKSLKISLSLLIVGFWAAMTGWLIKVNYNDGNAPFSDLPPLLVLHQVLKHEVVSQLGIFRDRHRVGSVSITPIHFPANSLSFDGNISFATEGERPESTSFAIRADLAADPSHLETITIRLRRRLPAMTALIEIRLKEKMIRYHVQNGGIDLGTQEMPISQEGFANFAPLLLGLPPLPMSPTGLLQSVELRANRASFEIRGEHTEGFRVVLSAAGAQATASLGQLGELFICRTSTEYQLLADGLDPEKYLP